MTATLDRSDISSPPMDSSREQESPAEDIVDAAPRDPRAAFCAAVLAMDHGHTVQLLLEEVDPRAAAERRQDLRRAAILRAQQKVAAMVPSLVDDLVAQGL